MTTFGFVDSEHAFLIGSLILNEAFSRFSTPHSTYIHIHILKFSWSNLSMGLLYHLDVLIYWREWNFAKYNGQRNITNVEEGKTTKNAKVILLNVWKSKRTSGEAMRQSNDLEGQKQNSVKLKCSTNLFKSL